MLQNPTILIDVTEPYSTLMCGRTLLYSKMLRNSTLLVMLQNHNLLLDAIEPKSTHYVREPNFTQRENPTLLLERELNFTHEKYKRKEEKTYF